MSRKKKSSLGGPKLKKNCYKNTTYKKVFGFLRIRKLTRWHHETFQLLYDQNMKQVMFLYKKGGEEEKGKSRPYVWRTIINMLSMGIEPSLLTKGPW